MVAIFYQVARDTEKAGPERGERSKDGKDERLYGLKKTSRAHFSLWFLFLSP